MYAWPSSVSLDLDKVTRAAWGGFPTLHTGYHSLSWNVQCMSKMEKSQNSFNLSFWYYMMRKGNMYDGQFQTNPWTICLRPFEQCALLKEALLSLFGGGNLKEIMGTRIIRKVDPQKENRPNPEIGMRTTNSWYWEYKDTPSNRHVPSGRLTGS